MARCAAPLAAAGAARLPGWRRWRRTIAVGGLRILTHRVPCRGLVFIPMPQPCPTSQPTLRIPSSYLSSPAQAPVTVAESQRCAQPRGVLTHQTAPLSFTPWSLLVLAMCTSAWCRLTTRPHLPATPPRLVSRWMRTRCLTCKLFFSASLTTAHSASPKRLACLHRPRPYPTLSEARRLPTRLPRRLPRRWPRKLPLQPRWPQPHRLSPMWRIHT